MDQSIIPLLFCNLQKLIAWTMYIFMSSSMGAAQNQAALHPCYHAWNKKWLLSVSGKLSLEWDEALPLTGLVTIRKLSVLMMPWYTVLENIKLLTGNRLPCVST